VGIAFDGDGDRVHMVDAKGNLINGDGVLFIIAMDRYLQNKLHGGVVGTLMTNMGLEVKFQDVGIPFVRTDVGDRYVLSSLKEKSWLIGGETSGHIVCLDRTTTGDGIIAALQVLARMVREQKPLEDLTKEVELYPQILFNYQTNTASQLLKQIEFVECIREIEAQLQGKGRVLVRASGTEPVLRILFEGPDAQQLQRQQQSLENFLCHASIDQV
ncbi:MAG: phosphoglucosamine mutase, partial [Pseudomonadota bacterium]|nr:phosphoglucosamine mutase [Pseudomonadota bacterium]